VAPHAYGTLAAAEAASLSSPALLAQIHMAAMRLRCENIFDRVGQIDLTFLRVCAMMNFQIGAELAAGLHSHKVARQK
jgi:hypothetical protein